MNDVSFISRDRMILVAVAVNSAVIVWWENQATCSKRDIEGPAWRFEFRDLIFVVDRANRLSKPSIIVVKIARRTNVHKLDVKGIVAGAKCDSLTRQRTYHAKQEQRSECHRAEVHALQPTTRAKAIPQIDQDRVLMALPDEAIGFNVSHPAISS